MSDQYHEILAAETANISWYWSLVLLCYIFQPNWSLDYIRSNRIILEDYLCVVRIYESTLVIDIAGIQLGIIFL